MSWLGLWQVGLRGPRAITLIGSTLGLLGVFITTLGFNVPFQFLSEPAWVFPGTMTAAAASGLVLFLGWLWLRRLKVPHPVSLTLGIYAVAGLARWATLVVLPTEPAAPAGNPLLGATEAVILSVVWLSLPAAGLARLDRHTELTEALRREQAVLAQTRDEIGNELQQDRYQLAELVEREITDNLDHLASSLSASDPRISVQEQRRLAAQLRRLSEDTVRPLSHQLATEALPASKVTPRPPVREVSHPTRTVSFANLVRAVSIRRPFPATPAVAVAALLALPSVLLLFGIRGAVAFLLFLTAGWIVLVLADNYLTAPMRQWTEPTTYAAILGIYVLTGSCVAVSALLFRPETEVTYVVVWASCLLLAILVSLTTAAVATIGQDWLIQERSLAATVSATEWEIGQISARKTASRESITHVLHGDIQGRLTATAMALGFAGQKGAGPFELNATETVSVALTNLEQSLASLRQLVVGAGSATNEDGILVGLSGLRTVWRGGLDVSAEVAPEAVSQIDAVESLGAAVLSIAGEAATNAARHGAATQLQITINIESGQLVIKAEDNGTGPRDTSNPGLGLAAAGRTQYTLERAPAGGCLLGARIPLA